MDRLLAQFPAVRDGDLMVWQAGGMAWQAPDAAVPALAYDAAYLEKVRAYEGSPIAQRVNLGRVALLQRHLEPGSKLLDIGAGSCDLLFDALTAGFDAWGYDIIPEAVAWMKEAGLYADDLAAFHAVCLWDTIEHVADPGVYLDRLAQEVWLFASIPVFADITRIRDSRHYRPGEHLYYWTAPGFVAWMALRGYQLIEQSDHETAAGRSSIGAFAFRRHPQPAKEIT